MMRKLILLVIITCLTVLTSQSQTSEGNIKIVISNKDFLLLGDNNPKIISPYTTTFLCSPEKTINKVWKVIELGTVGIVKISTTVAELDPFLNTTNTLKFLKIADDDTFTINVDYIPVELDTIDGISQYSAFYDFDGTKFFTYSELNAIVWSGDTNSWHGGSGINESPHTINDTDKLMIIDAQLSQTNAFLNTPTNVNCAWVKNNSKLIVNNNSSLSILNHLKLDGELRMIGNAQLMQTHTGQSQVTGLGKIFIDQLGTASTTYRFNYWSSPVVEIGKNTFTVGNVMKDGTIPTSETSTPLDIQFTTAFDGSKTSPISISNYWIFTYDNGNTASDWIQKKDNLSILPPLGFTMKGPGNGMQNYTFVGTPNDGVYTSSIDAGKLSLLGNPYPSALDADQFINDNLSSIVGTIYFWEMSGDSGNHYQNGYVGGYSMKNLDLALAANSIVEGTAGLGDGSYLVPGRYVPVGQGFYISSATGGPIVFNNAQRNIQPIDTIQSVFFKANNKTTTILNQSNKNKETSHNLKKIISKLKLGFEYQNLDGQNIHRQIGLAFKENNSFAFDNGYDSYMLDTQPTDMYFKFEKDPSKYVAAGVGSFDKSLEIPLEIDIATTGNFNFMIDYLDNPDTHNNIYLKDAENITFYNLSDGVKSLNLDSGIYQNRFFITFKKNRDNEHIKDLKSNDLIVYFDKENSEIVIIKNKLIINKIELNNLIFNKNIKHWKHIKNSDKIKLPIKNISDGIYLIKLETNKGLITKKLFLLFKNRAKDKDLF